VAFVHAWHRRDGGDAGSAHPSTEPRWRRSATRVSPMPARPSSFFAAAFAEPPRVVRRRCASSRHAPERRCRARPRSGCRSLAGQYRPPTSAGDVLTSWYPRWRGRATRGGAAAMATLS
jgi:hypothetical protein